MKKHFSIDQLSTATLRHTQSQAAIMRRDLNRLRDSITGLNHLGHVPVINSSRKKTKKTIQTSPWQGIAGIVMSELANTGIFGSSNMKISGTVKVGEFSFTNSASSSAQDGDNGYRSNAQSAGNALGALIAAQRNR